MRQIPNSRLLKIIALIWVFIQADPGIAFGQKSRKQLEKEKRENLRKLEQTNQILKEVKKEKKASISELNVLKQQTRLKDRKINTIHEELGLIQTDISLLETEQNQLTLNLVNIKKEYAAMVYAASKASTANQMMYLFASETFNQFWMRLQYLRFYSDARRKQVAQMSQVKQELVQKQSKLAEVKVGKEVLLTTEEQEKRQLELLKSDKDKVVNELAMRESELRDRIDKQKESVRRLERMLSDLVAAEIRKSRRYNGPPNPNESDDGVDQRMSLTPEGKLISKSFAGNKNKLAWPVQNGFISTGFGRHEHAVLKRIYVDNLGIDISTKPGEKVRSVFEGTVGMVGQVPGMEGQIVMLRHGEYFTVYSGLKNVTVNTGEKIKMKQVIGEVIRDDEDGAILQFQVWKNSKRLDPEDWLAND